MLLKLFIKDLSLFITHYKRQLILHSKGAVVVDLMYNTRHETRRIESYSKSLLKAERDLAAWNFIADYKSEILSSKKWTIETVYNHLTKGE